MLNLQLFIDQLAEFWAQRARFRALIAFLILLNFIIVPAISSVTYFFLTNIGIIDSTLAFTRFAFSLVAGTAALNLLLLASWLYWRSLPTIPVEKVGVFFAPHVEPECEPLVLDLYEQFKRDLAKRNLTTVVTHDLVPQSYVIEKPDDANQLLSLSGARLVIYGQVQKGKVRGKGVQGFRSISFTVKHRSLDENEMKSIAKTMAGALALRSFAFSDDHSFIEKTIVIQNLSEVARFFIALALTLDGKIGLSEPLLDDLLSEVRFLKKRRPPQRAQLESFYNSIVSCMTLLLENKLMRIYDAELVDHITDSAANDHMEAYEQTWDKLYKIVGTNSHYSLGRAIARFHFGQIDEAKALIQQAKRQMQKDSAGPHFSAAFLALWEERYDAALREYRRTERCSDFDMRMIVDVIRFLDGVLALHPERKQLLFGLAFVNDSFFDRTRAMEEYQTFLGEAQGRKDINILQEFAQKRLTEFSNANRQQ